ncbi:MAG: recombinase family protein [Alphaproteobacteria bacterium]
MDFAKLVEIFDAHGVTFVSVTQSFNTTTSMGRLTLNVLLSFAQFEREVSAERIRDKIAASKKKGMWMGGNPPLGYRVENRQLLINDKEAPLARHIFERYLKLGSVKKLMQELDRDGKKSPPRVSQRGNKLGGATYSRGALYAILKNPIYIGKIRHKDQTYDGQHEALIDEDVWNRVQETLDKPVGGVAGQKKVSHRNLLQGLLFDSDGTIYSPVHSKRPSGKSYRYYVSQNLIQYRDHPKGAMARLPAHEIEQAVLATINKHLITSALLADLLCLDETEDYAVLQHITGNTIDLEALTRCCVTRVLIGQDEFAIEGDLPKLRAYLEASLRLAIPACADVTTFTLATAFTTQRSHKGAVILRPGNAEQGLHDLPPVQLRNLVRGVIWRDRHFAGDSIRDIARQENLSEAGIRKIIMGSFDTLISL